MILQPTGMVRVLVKVLRGHMVVLAGNHQAEAAKEAFGLIGIHTVVVAVGFAVVDAVSYQTGMQRIPMCCLIGIEDAAFAGDAGGDGNAFRFAVDDEGMGATLTLAKRQHDAALTVLVLDAATVNAVGFEVGRADVAAEVCAVDFNLTFKRLVGDLGGESFAEFVRSTNAVLCWQFRSRESWRAEIPLTELTKMQIAASRSV